MFKAAFGAGPPDQVLGDVEASRRPRWREQAFLGTWIEDSFVAADHGLTKTLRHVGGGSGLAVGRFPSGRRLTAVSKKLGTRCA